MALSLLALVAGPSALAHGSEAKAERLPIGVAPDAYRIFVEPRPEHGKFSGNETISVQISKPTKKIVLNAIELDVRDATYTAAGQQSKDKLEIAYDKDAQQLILTAPQELKVGGGSVDLQFDGKLNDQLKGFFRTSYRDEKGDKHWLSATQMEPTDARQMFPCFDEPQYKATFKISASIERQESAISNAPLKEEKIDKSAVRKVVTFEETPKMSTYLVALVVGELVPTDPVTVQGVPIRVWSRPDKKAFTSFSQNLAAKLLPYYIDYFGVQFPSKKLDLIAIPDFSFGAMENLGAITFQETDLLVDEHNGSISAKQNVAINVAHEISHMWFGDLVTMAWWDDIWLNEAFATWMSTKAIDKLVPDWHYWNEFSMDRQTAMLSDSLNATRAIHTDVEEPEQIEQLFDEITYNKGGSVLRMLERFVGEDEFRDGVRQYIKAHELGNATRADLWDAITKQSGKDVAAVMQSWIDQEGFPLLIVRQSKTILAILQRRFLLLPENDSEKAGQTWQIPLELRTLSSLSSPIQKFLDGKEGTTLKLMDVAPQLVNAGGEGFYRIRYSPETLHAISSKLKELTPLERSAVISDEFYLAIANRIPIKDYFELTNAYKGETNPTVARTFCKLFEQLDLMIDDKSVSPFADFVRDRLSPASKSLGWSGTTDDSELTKLARSEVLLMLGTIGQDKQTIDQARNLWKQYLQKKVAIEPDLFATIIKIVAYNGNADDYDEIEETWQSAKSPEQERSALLALGMFREPALLQRTLRMCLTDKVRRQDGPKIIAQVMSTRTGRVIAWNFMHKHILHIAWRFPEHSLREIVMQMNSLGNREQLVEVRAFFKKHPAPSQSRSIDKILEAITVRVLFNERHGQEIEDWLIANTKAQVSSR